MARPTTGRIAHLGGVVTVIAATAFTSGASAQEPAPPAQADPSVTATTPAPPPPPPIAAPAPPAPPPVMPSPPGPAPAVEHAPSDLDVEARRWAIGYAGLSQVPVGSTTIASLTVPAIGVRYWANPTVGIDFGFGFGWAGGSRESNGVSTDKDSVSGFIFQAGLPFALSTHRHVSFQIIPFVAVAHGQTTETPIPGSGQTTPTDFSGTRIDIGARAGFELFFGFIGIPELALSATIGMQFESRKFSANAGGITASDTELGFSTTVQNNPWDIFTSNVAARYYF